MRLQGRGGWAMGLRRMNNDEKGNFYWTGCTEKLPVVGNRILGFRRDIDKVKQLGTRPPSNAKATWEKEMK